MMKPTRIAVILALLSCASAWGTPAEDNAAAKGDQQLVVCAAAYKVLSERMLEDIEAGEPSMVVPAGYTRYLNAHVMYAIQLERATRKMSPQVTRQAFEARAVAYRSLVPRMEDASVLLDVNRRFCWPEFKRENEAGRIDRKKMADVEAREKALVMPALTAALEKGIKTMEARGAARNASPASVAASTATPTEPDARMPP